MMRKVPLRAPKFQIPGRRGQGFRTPGSGGGEGGDWTPGSERKGLVVWTPLSQSLPFSSPQSCYAGGHLDSQGDPLPPAPPPPSDPTPQVTSPPRSPVANSSNSSSAGCSHPGSRRGAGPASWEPTWESGTAPPALTQEEGAWPLRVTLLQSSF